jgi:hypothetical protein
MAAKHTHPKDCADQKDAAADRRARATVVSQRQQELEVWARAQWLDWFPPNPYGTLRA